MTLKNRVTPTDDARPAALHIPDVDRSLTLKLQVVSGSAHIFDRPYQVNIKDGNVYQTINVQNPTYGAKGDGIADDTAAINNAVVAANALTGHAKRQIIVYFPKGTYRSWRVRSNCRSEHYWSGPGNYDA